MPRTRTASPRLVPTALPPHVPTEGGEEAPSSRAFGIDDYVTSPWIGLHYRHEFLLHCNHELLEYQQPKNQAGSRTLICGQ